MVDPERLKEELIKYIVETTEYNKEKAKETVDAIEFDFLHTDYSKSEFAKNIIPEFLLILFPNLSDEAKWVLYSLYLILLGNIISLILGSNKKIVSDVEDLNSDSHSIH